MILRKFGLAAVLGFVLFSQSIFAAPTHPNSGFAVVLIDMQIGFYERGGTTRSQGLHELRVNQLRLLDWAVRKHIPVLVFEYEGFRETDPLLMRVLTRSDYRVIQKRQDGAFYDPRTKAEALAILDQWKVDSLIVAGINGPYCVASTIRSALDLGFNVMTTPWVNGNINHNPPTFPNGSWHFKHATFTVFPSLKSIIQ